MKYIRQQKTSHRDGRLNKNASPRSKPSVPRRRDEERRERGFQRSMPMVDMQLQLEQAMRIAIKNAKGRAVMIKSCSSSSSGHDQITNVLLPQKRIIRRPSWWPDGSTEHDRRLTLRDKTYEVITLARRRRFSAGLRSSPTSESDDTSNSNCDPRRFKLITTVVPNPCMCRNVRSPPK